MNYIFKLTVLTFIFSFSITASLQGQQIIDKGEYTEILNESPTGTSDIQLQFVRKYGGINASNPNELFYRPMDLVCDSQGNLYVLDTGNKRIQVFDTTGKFKSTIGGEGYGPAEFQNPVAIEIDQQDVLTVFDSRTNLVLTLDTAGEEINRNSFRAQVLQKPILLNSNNFLSITFVWNSGGAGIRLTRTAGDFMFPEINTVDIFGNVLNVFSIQHNKFDDLNMSLRGNNIFYCVDTKDNIVLAFELQNKLMKYDMSGKIIYVSSRRKEFEETQETEFIVNPQTRGRKPMSNIFSMGIGVDSDNRTWVLSINRKISKEEFIDLQLSKPGMILEVYDENGILLQTIPLDTNQFRLSLWVLGNRLFLLDTWQDLALFEYRIAN